MSTLQPSADYSNVEALCDRGFRFSPTPMMLLDRDGVIRQFNCSLRELMRTDLAGCLGQGCRRLKAALGDRIEGQLFPAERNAAKVEHGQSLKMKLDDLVVAESTCRYRSQVYGTVELRCIEAPCIETASGEFFGSLVSLELLPFSKSSEFRKAVIKRMTHELMWQVYAASYDQILLEMPFYVEVLQRHFSSTSGGQVRTVIDLGAGTGNLAAQLLGIGKQVTAVDITSAMLDKLRSKVEDSKRSNLTIIEDTAESLPDLESGTYDAVSVLLALFDMSDPFSALEEALRLLRPNGVVIITEPKRSFNVAQLMEFAETHLRQNELMDQLQHDWDNILKVAPIINQQIKETKLSRNADVIRTSLHAEDVFEILKERGFTDLKMEDSHLGNCATIVAKKPGD